MSDTDKRETPLKSPSIEGHHCTVGLRLEKLGMVPFFQGLTEEQLHTVNNKFTANHYERGVTIYRQGDPATMLRVVVVGSVKLVSHTMDGNDILLDQFRRQIATMCTMIQPQTSTCILSIRRTDFRDIMNEYSSVAISVLDITTERLNASRQRIQHLSSLSVKKRIAHILVTLANKFGEKHPRGLLIQLPLSRKDLADMAGTSAETTSRIMSEFQEEDLITSGRQWVAINDKPELLRISAED